MIKNQLVYPMLVSCLLAGGCKSDFDNIEVKRFTVDSDQSQTLKGLATIEQAIVSDWGTATANLRNAVIAFKNNPTSDNLKSAQDLWKLARNPWESNESFGFGPVSTLNIDPNSDDWPFDITAFMPSLAQAYRSTPITSIR